MSKIDDLLSGGPSAIERLLGEPEGLNLEFKAKERPERPELSKDDKRNLGKALSGFSNADGGVLILGIKTRQLDHLDVASELQPISDIARFKNEVDGRIGELIRPENTEISTHAIGCTDDRTAGYLVVQIGRSINRPHMSIAPGHTKYFRRTFDSTIVMDHGLIRDMVLAPREAILRPVFNSSWPSMGTNGEDTVMRIDIEIHIENTGPSMASMPYVLARTVPKLIHKNVNSMVPSAARADGSIAYYGSRDAVIHPRDTVLFGAFSMDVAVRTSLLMELDLINQVDALRNDVRFFQPVTTGMGLSTGIDELELVLSYGAENAPSIEKVITFSESDLVTLILPSILVGADEGAAKQLALDRALAQIEKAFGAGLVAKI